ncbi:putative disease resistance protein RGA3 [Nymphaea colorata]|nr:putative disease resistance protein RGA3 [Nymphaea colorata]
MTGKRDVFIISIVGEGGIGKTTLAKIVFSEVKQQFEERRWWVCVSERPKGKDLLRKILKEGEVESTLMRGAMGSKILITSRNIDVSKGIGALYMHRWPMLREDESWNLFLNKALRTEIDLVRHKLQDIAKAIVKKCGGLPLVVQTVGSLMRTKNMKKAEWKEVADSVIWEWKMPASSSSSQYGSILPGLILSYDDLPPYLRSCFVYCSIFPKNHEIKREGLIMQWVAHGGKEYRHASATEQTRHLSLHGEAAMQYNASVAANKVRTILLSASLSSVEFTNFKWLRVLSLRGCQMDELPNSIECLSLPKYLDLSVSNVRRLPSSIANMPALESLEVRYCHSLEQVGEMPALKSLKVDRCDGLKALANMPALESPDVRDCNSLEQVADYHMPALKRLRLSDLNTLKQLPTRLPSLEELIMENLANWEGWAAAATGETIFTSMPCLREAYFYKCPKMQTQGMIDELARLQTLRVTKCPSARLGWKLLKNMPNLIYLELDGPALESTLPSPLSLQVSTFLPSLESLTLKDNNTEDLKWGKVPESVWGLSQLKELRLESFTEDISLGGRWQCLPKLKDLRLSDFPNLKSLVDVNNITPQQNEPTCPTDAQEQIACLSKLDCIHISTCPALDLLQVRKKMTSVAIRCH